MNTNAVNIAVVDGKTITEATELRANPQGHPVRIKAVANGKYILAEGDKGVAPENITIKRVGKDLHVALEGTDPDQPQLIIEGFFDAAGQLVGVAEDGAYHEYIASDAEPDHEAAFLMDGVSAPQVLGAEQLDGFDGLVAATGIGWFWPALLGLGALAAAGAIWASNRDDGGHHDDLLMPTVPKLDDVEDNVGDKTGKIENGDTTDDTTPTFSGTGTPGNTVIIKDGDKVIGEVVVGGDGKWEFIPETPLAEGDHTIVVVEKDPAGNESEPSPGFEFVVDATAPAQSEIKQALDDFGDHTGLIPQDGVTDDNTPTLSGTAEAGSTVEIFANGEKIGDTVALADGTWSFTPSTALADGEYSFTSVAVDAAGNRGLPSLPYDLIVDTRGELIKIDHVMDDAGTLLHELQTGDVTDDTTPTLSGQATPNSQVNIYDNGLLIGSAPVDADGQWTFTPDTPLAEGQHGFTATVVTLANGESAPTPVFDLEIDITAPGKPGADGNGGIDEVDDNVGLIRGPIENGDSTDDPTPTLSGGGQEPGGTVIIKDNGTIIGTVPVKDDGSWEFTPDPALPDGDHDFSIIVTDPAGNASEESDPYKVIIDTQAPAAPAITSVLDDQGDHTGNLAPGELTDDSKPDISGTAEAGSTVIIYDNGVEIGRAPVDASGNWTFTPEFPLSNGPHELSAKAQDPAGNVSEPSNPFDFDLLAGGAPTAPAITGALDAFGDKTGNISPGGVTDDKRPTLSGTGEPGSTVKVYADGVLVGTGQVGSDGHWTVPLTSDLHENLNNITATTTDAVGNVSPETAAYPVILDTTPPAASAETLTDDVGPIFGTIHDKDTTDDNTPTASGNAEPGTTVIIYDKGVEIGRVPVKEDGSWSFTPTTPLQDGDHSFSTIVEDAAGNHSPKSDETEFTVDTSAVQISITRVFDNEGTLTGPLQNGAVTDDTTPTLSGQATANSQVNIYDNGVLLGSVTSDANGKWAYTPTTPLPEGDHSFTATVVTAGGGESLPTGKFDIEIDTTAPGKPGAEGNGGIDLIDDNVGLIRGPIADGDSTDDTTPTLSGGGQEPGDTVTIIDNGTVIGTAPVKDDGSWAFTPNPPLNDGDHDFSIIVTDPAGNASEESDPYKVIIDTQAPSKPEITTVFDDQGDQTGNINQGDTTDDAQPQISGTAEAGSTVIIYDNGVEIGRVPADDSGHWTFTPTLPLTNGPHDLSAKAEDKAGNVSEESDPFDFSLIAGGVPAAPAITGALDDFGDKTGNISPGGVTDD
ncbi:MAG: Ig-like domain-containing protein [Pseudomonas sp.]|uniref:Ig-like domain-containing protein n=1 Tax=Pseudomonas sp. TaxID=306 RepID=UPI003C78D810